MITVEEMVRNTRIASQITQSELADKLGVHKQFVSNFERELCRIPLGYFETIGRLLNLDVDLMVEVRIANLSQETLEFFNKKRL